MEASLRHRMQLLRDACSSCRRTRPSQARGRVPTSRGSSGRTRAPTLVSRVGIVSAVSRRYVRMCDEHNTRLSPCVVAVAASGELVRDRPP
eukprot:3571435-Prymnesium_polylepis.1